MPAVIPGKEACSRSTPAGELPRGPCSAPTMAPGLTAAPDPIRCGACPQTAGHERAGYWQAVCHRQPQPICHGAAAPRAGIGPMPQAARLIGHCTARCLPTRMIHTTATCGPMSLAASAGHSEQLAAAGCQPGLAGGSGVSWPARPGCRAALLQWQVHQDSPRCGCCAPWRSARSGQCSTCVAALHCVSAHMSAGGGHLLTPLPPPCRVRCSCGGRHAGRAPTGVVIHGPASCPCAAHPKQPRWQPDRLASLGAASMLLVRAPLVVAYARAPHLARSQLTWALCAGAENIFGVSPGSAPITPRGSGLFGDLVLQHGSDTPQSLAEQLAGSPSFSAQVRGARARVAQQPCPTLLHPHFHHLWGPCRGVSAWRRPWTRGTSPPSCACRPLRHTSLGRWLRPLRQPLQQGQQAAADGSRWAGGGLQQGQFASVRRRVCRVAAGKRRAGVLS